MKIALCSKGTFSLEIGSTKNRIELAEGLEKLGWETVLVDLTMLGISKVEQYNSSRFNEALKQFLILNASDYQVVLYEYDTLPFDRNLFSKNTLFVARPAILHYHLNSITFKYNLKVNVSHLYRRVVDHFNGRNKAKKKFFENIDYSLEQCDLIQVQNSKDKALLITKGFKKDKIEIVPNGISHERLDYFAKHPLKFSQPFVVVCVGTFDFRKGAMDFPYIFRQLIKRFPNVRLKLLGTSGTFSSKEQVLSFFPKSNRNSIEVVPKFKATELPNLLSDCHVGIFPSYLESFGFGALEMMGAGLPVIAYDAPGPSDFILPELLVKTGDKIAFADRVLSLLTDPELLQAMSKEASASVTQKYCWDDIAKKADNYYRSHLEQISVNS